MNKKREIFIRIEKTEKIIELLKEIRATEEKIQKLFSMHDRLNVQENKLFENWSGTLEDIIQRLDHVTL